MDVKFFLSAYKDKLAGTPGDEQLDLVKQVIDPNILRVVHRQEIEKRLTIAILLLIEILEERI